MNLASTKTIYVAEADTAVIPAAVLRADQPESAYWHAQASENRPLSCLLSSAAADHKSRSHCKKHRACCDTPVAPRSRIQKFLQADL